MSDYNKIMYEIEEEYFLILEEKYGSFYTDFKNSGLDKRRFIVNFLERHKYIKLPHGEDDLSFRRRELKNNIVHFWKQKRKYIHDCLNNYSNIGVFGSGDDKYSFYYENEIKQNALYYDLLILNDPLFISYAHDKDYMFESFFMNFYCNVLTLLELKQYILTESKQMYVIIFPTDGLEESKNREKIFEESGENADKIAKEIFGLDYSMKSPLWKNFEILKNLTDREIQEKLAKSEIYIDIREAQHYEYYLMSDESKREWFEFMIEGWGTYNQDFMRCVLNYSIIKNIISTNHYIYKVHCMQSLNLNANPIFNRDEWQPFKYDVAGCSYPASNEFKYMCAVHRNDKMAVMIQMTAPEIEKYREGKEVEKFRDFLRKTVNSIHNTPDCFEEISKDVFDKFDTLLENECNNICKAKKNNNFKAIWGIGKAILGYVPYISYLVTTADLGSGIKNLWNSLNDKESILETISKRNLN